MKMNARAGKLMVQVLFLLLLTDLALSEANSRLPARLLAKQTGAAQFEEHIEQPIRPDCNEHRHRLRKRSSDEDLDYEVYQGVVGRPGIDFPIFPRIPQTTFSCRSYGNGYFADLETSCQVFHICEEGRKISFLCPNGTIFQQSELTCDWWFKVNCAGSPGFYAESAEILHKARKQRVKPTAVYKGFTNNKVVELLPTGKPFKKSDRRIDSNENPSIESLDFEDISDDRSNDRSTERTIKSKNRSSGRSRNRSSDKLKIQKDVLLTSSAPESPIHQHNEHELQITAETSSFVKDPRQNSYTDSEKTLNKERVSVPLKSSDKVKDIQAPKRQSIVRSGHRNDFHQKQKTGKKIDVEDEAGPFITVRPDTNEVSTSDDGLRADLETPDEGGVPSQIILIGKDEGNDLGKDQRKNQSKDEDKYQGKNRGNNQAKDEERDENDALKQKSGKRLDGFFITVRPDDIGSSTVGKDGYHTTAHPETYKNRNSVDNPEDSDKQFVTPNSEDRKVQGPTYSTLKPDYFANGPMIKSVTSPSVYPGTYSTARRIDSTRTTPFYTPTVPTVIRAKPTDSKSYSFKLDQPTTLRGAITTDKVTPIPLFSDRTPNSEIHRFPVYSNGDLKVQLPVYNVEERKPAGLTLTTSTSGPTYLPKVTERTRTKAVTPASIVNTVSQNIRGILDTVGVIKETMKANFEEKTPGARVGLDIPPSSGPGTLISLTNYFANDDEQTETTVSSEQEKATTTTPVDISAGLLSNKTSGKYLSLFGLDQDNKQDDEDVTATTIPPKTVSAPTVVGDFTRTTIKDLAQNPETRKIAQVFSNAITKYIENPETFRKDLIDVRPTAPTLSASSISDTPVTTPTYFNKGGTVTVSIIADTTLADGILSKGVTTPYTERYETTVSPTTATESNDIAKEINSQFDGTTPSYEIGSTESTEATTYRGSSFSTSRPRSYPDAALSSELLPPSQDEEMEHESLHKVQSQSFVKSYNDLTKSPKAIAFDKTRNTFETAGGKATTAAYPWSKNSRDKDAPTENPWLHAVQNKDSTTENPLSSSVQDKSQQNNGATTENPLSYSGQGKSQQNNDAATENPLSYSGNGKSQENNDGITENPWSHLAQDKSQKDKYATTGNLQPHLVQEKSQKDKDATTEKPWSLLAQDKIQKDKSPSTENPWSHQMQDKSQKDKDATTDNPWSHSALDKIQKNKVPTTENPWSPLGQDTTDTTTEKSFETTTNQAEYGKATEAPWSQLGKTSSKNKPFSRPLDEASIYLQDTSSGKTATTTRKPWSQSTNTATVDSSKTPESGSSKVKPTENPWTQITHSIYLDPLTINDGLMREPKATTLKPFDFVNTDRSRFEDVSENEEDIEDILNSPELSSELLPKNNGLQRIANKIFGGLNETEAIHLKNVMKKAEHNQSVLRLLLLLIQTCDDQDGKALEKSRKILLNALIGMDSKLQSKKPPQQQSITTTNKIPVTTYRRNFNESPTTVLTPTTTDAASSEETTKFEIRVPDLDEEPDKTSTLTSASTEQQSTSYDNPNRTSDQRALELLKSLYSLASKFSRR